AARSLVLEIDDRLLRGAAGNEGCGLRGVQDALGRKIVGIGVAGALAGDDANAASGADALGGGFYERLVNADGGRVQIFEVEVGVGSTGRQGGGQIFLQVGIREAEAVGEKRLIHEGCLIDAARWCFELFIVACSSAL